MHRCSIFKFWNRRTINITTDGDDDDDDDDDDDTLREKSL